LNNQGPSAVKLGLPRWKTEYTASDLVGNLKSMGVTSAFSESADFSKITGGTNLFISNIFHKACVDVSEKGTEAAAATIVREAYGSGAPANEAPIITVDHPFFYLIVETQTHAILFAGTESDPSP